MWEDKSVSACEPEAACFLPHLQIKVGDLFAVHEADTFQNLLQEVDSLVLRHVLLRCNEVKKLAALDAKPQTDTGIIIIIITITKNSQVRVITMQNLSIT